MENYSNVLNSGIDIYKARLDKIKSIYAVATEYANKFLTDDIVPIVDQSLFTEIIKNFVTALDDKNTKFDLSKVYDVAYHKKSGALIIANKGATLFSLTEKFATPHIVRHIGLCVYMPEYGVEYANAGIVGDVYSNAVVLRTESACTPSFLFGSQRCNCYYQWKNIRELSASFNKISPLKTKNGNDFESWVQNQFTYSNGKHIYSQKSKIGFVLLHIDSQNGMGSGYTENEFVFDLSERASMRHRGEYTSEQTFKTTMYGGFTAIGINGDPRSAKDNAGYKITPIILDFLKVNKNIVMLTNNPLKMKSMTDFGYKLERIKSIGAVSAAGATEALQRGSEFNHLDINGDFVSFKEDYNRIRKEIKQILL